MNGSTRRSGYGLVLAAVLLSVIAGIIAYNIGVSHGLAQTAIAAAAQNAPGGAVPPYAYYYGYRPWGFGFGFPILFFVFVWFVLLRGMWWRGGPWRHPYYSGGPGGVPPAFDEWHRRAHDRMKESPSADNPDRRG